MPNHKKYLKQNFCPYFYKIFTFLITFSCMSQQTAEARDGVRPPNILRVELIGIKSKEELSAALGEEPTKSPQPMDIKKNELDTKQTTLNSRQEEEKLTPRRKITFPKFSLFKPRAKDNATKPKQHLQAIQFNPKLHSSGLRSGLHYYQIPTESSERLLLSLEYGYVEENYKNTGGVTEVDSKGAIHKTDVELKYKPSNHFELIAGARAALHDTSFKMDHMGSPMFDGKGLGYNLNDLNITGVYSLPTSHSKTKLDLGARIPVSKNSLNGSNPDYYFGVTNLLSLSGNYQIISNINYTIFGDLNVFDNGFNAISPADSVGLNLGIAKKLNSKVEQVHILGHYSTNPLNGATGLSELDKDLMQATFGMLTKLNQRTSLTGDLSFGVSDSAPGYSFSFGMDYSL